MVARKNSENGLVLVITDSEIIGKVFTEKKMQLDLSKPFYQGTLKEKEKLKQQIPTAYVLHFTGVQAVTFGVELDLIDPQKILTVQKVPHAEVIITS